MIDGVTIYMRGDTGRAWKGALLDELIHRDTHTYRGRYKNFLIYENAAGVSISGSVAKYVQGDNIDGCDMAVGLDKLGEALHIDLHKGIMRAAEFAVTVFTEQPIHEYLVLLGNMKGGRLTVKRYSSPLETVEYSTRKGGEAFKAYDKKAEILSHGERVLDGFEGYNLLRLELRICNQTSIKKWLGGGRDISPYDFAFYWDRDNSVSHRIYNRFKERFLFRYKSIEKTGREVHMTNKAHIIRSFLDCLALYTAQHNADVFNGFMASAKAAGMSKCTASRIRSTLRKAAADIEQVGGNELIDEVNGWMECNL